MGRTDESGDCGVSCCGLVARQGCDVGISDNSRGTRTVKFCYVDESAPGDGAYVVVVGVVVDGLRMHLTKGDWDTLLTSASRRLGRALPEFKASDLYRGSGRWNGVSWADRSGVVTDVLSWLANRKHTIIFTGASETPRAALAATRIEIADLPDPWCVAATHLILALQRAHQKLPGAKGHTVLVADETSHRVHLTDFVRSPFSWSDAYYGRPPRRRALDQIVDVPYFADSRHVLLIQTADLLAYILRRYVELSGVGASEMVRGERANVEVWSRAIASRSPLSSVWPRRGGTGVDELFRALAPPPLADLRP